MSGPPLLSQVEPVPHGRTARRLGWAHLPPTVRTLVEQRLGSPVVDARSQDGGFTPGFASRLSGADGSRLFVKAASRRAQRHIAESYAEEARKLSLLPMDLLPAPRLLWTHEDEAWVVLGFEDVSGRAPARPWRPAELERCLATLSQITTALGPERHLVERLGLRPIHEELPALVHGWDEVGAAQPEWPHLEDLRVLARRLPHLALSITHTDARDDNFILAHDGRVLLCDWNWLALAPAWIDAIDVLVSAHGDGLDAERLVLAHPLTAEVPPDDVDAWLAALCGFMMSASMKPEVPSSPYLRVHTEWYAAAVWDWLSTRRGW